MPTQKPRHANQANNHGLSGMATLQQMWERIHPRCAARAALDLIGAEDAAANALRDAPRGRRSI
ncbi:hypothetical protein [Pseudomonas muyukensis]|uniref:Uncharacterized protein n=1 Tax=Pseudomonas muyukensis TaxID=2842357 RepID=A0ABX8M9R1_9PSED|nr:hypothetical protein [Pseudomonas muyukensis]QXH35282.1 hypothetical protein KSS95_00170 [Pseudomonas muyukensis]